MLVHCRLQVNVFLSRLCGQPIGFTVVGIFVIDKHTILTVHTHTARILDELILYVLKYFVKLILCTIQSPCTATSMQKNVLFVNDRVSTGGNAKCES